jgi:hypothetical protein
MASVVEYEGFEGLQDVGEVAKEVLKGSAIGAVTGLGTVLLVNKLPVIGHMNPVVKGLVGMGIVIGISALAKDKVGDAVATGMGVGGGALVLGTTIGEIIKSRKQHAVPKVATPPKHGYGDVVAVVPEVDYEGYGYGEGYGDAVAPVVDVESEEYEGYGDAVAPVVDVESEEYEGYGEGYGYGEDVEAEYQVPGVDGYGDMGEVVEAEVVDPAGGNYGNIVVEPEGELVEV